MATPEEQKATLHANRLARPVSSTPNTPPANTDSRPHDRRSALQSSRLRAFALATALALAPSPSNQTPQQDETSQIDALSEEDSTQQAQAQQAQRLAGIQAAVSAQTRQQQTQTQQSQQVNEKTRQQQEIKKVAKATMRRGAIYVISALSAPLLIVDIIIWLFTLGWLNLEMIYGTYFAKGKSRYIEPLSWDPIPMPIDKKAIILSGFIVAADLALGVAILIISFGGFCLVHDFVKVTGSITGAAQIGASLAQGGSGGLCLGGIISSAFGL